MGEGTIESFTKKNVHENIKLVSQMKVFFEKRVSHKTNLHNPSNFYHSIFVFCTTFFGDYNAQF